MSTSAELSDALAGAEPSDVVVVADGTYEGEFVADRPGRADAPITLCGSPSAVLTAGSTERGYTLHLDGVSHWRVEGLTVRGGAKGIVLDGSSDNELVDVRVEQTGEEAVHLRRHSSDNLVQGARITGAGLLKPDIGEGIYVGSAESNWCSLTDCEPDRSDRNSLIGNTIDQTSAEAIDVKEGTSSGVVRDNTLDGAGMTAADSLIDVKGNDWTVEGSSGTSAPARGIGVYRILDGWGERNVFRGNRVEVPSDGWVIEVFGAARSYDNVVDCTNVAVVAGREAPDRVVPRGCGADGAS